MEELYKEADQEDQEDKERRPSVTTFFSFTGTEVYTEVDEEAGANRSV